MITIRVCDTRDRRTASFAEVRVVASWLDDPVIPAQLFEADVQGFAATLRGGGATLQSSTPAPLAGILSV